MNNTFSEKVQEYRVRYITPTILYLRKEKGVLSNRVDYVPRLGDYMTFWIMVCKEIIVRIITK